MNDVRVADWLILLKPDQVHIAMCQGGSADYQSLDLSGLSAEVDQAQLIGTTLRDHGYLHGPVVLALPSRQCMAAVVSDEGLPKGQRRQAMCYRFEEKLPIALEDVAVDFVPASSGAFGVCVAHEPLTPLIVALEASGVFIDSICPLGLLGLEAARQSVKIEDECLILIGEDGYINAFSVNARGVSHWHLLPDDLSDMRRVLDLEKLRKAGPVKLALFGVSSKVEEVICGSQDVVVDVIESTTAEALAVRAGTACIRGDADWAPNLRRDSLAVADPYRSVRKPLRFAFAATLLGLVCLSVVFLWRGGQYKAQLAELSERQYELFRDTLPGQRVPASVRLRLESEMLRLRGISGESSGVPRKASAFNVLYETLRRLPAELRYRVLDIRIDGDRVYLEGEVRSHSDADLIAAALRRQDGLDVEPPKSQQLSGRGVSFTLTGLAPTTTSGDSAGVSQVAQREDMP